jgi:hypothetical protein
MAKFLERLDPILIAFVERQLVYFVATAPEQGRMSLSPKGTDSFRIVDEKTVCWIDLGGSGNETAAHLRQNGRVIIMFCSFEGKPLILRLYGTARALHRRHAEWADHIGRFGELPAARQMFLMHIDSLQTSCGLGVPVADGLRERPRPAAWTSAATLAEQEARWRERGQHTSIDGLPTGLFED